MQLQDSSLLKTRCLLAGEWKNAGDGRTMQVINPANGANLATVPCLDRKQTQEAIVAAEAALPAWCDCTAQERSTILRRWYELVVANTDDLATIMTSEQGKPLAEAAGEINYAAGFIQWFSEEAKRVYGDTIPAPTDGQRLVAIRQPIGVCAAITPWNFPAAMITRKVGPALAAGCVMIVKPARQTPLTALALGELAQRAGVPAGVLQIITGDSTTIGSVLTASPVVRKLSFTGSTEIGRVLMAQSAPTLKRLSLELGGNAPFIVFDDADLDAAVEGAIASKYRNTGQTCVCANRLLVQQEIYHAFAERLAQRVRQLKVGDGMEPGVVQGPLIDEPAVQKVLRHVEDALAKGGRILCGGKRHALGRTYFEPTVIADARDDMLCAHQETFGPVAPLFKFSNEQDAIRMANATEYGLAAYLYSKSLARCVKVSEALEYGMVGINTGLISNPVAPFGGIKQSGFGREGGKCGIDEYLQYKYLCLGGLA